MDLRSKIGAIAMSAALAVAAGSALAACSSHPASSPDATTSSTAKPQGRAPSTTSTTSGVDTGSSAIGSETVDQVGAQLAGLRTLLGQTSADFESAKEDN